jgi:small subunit ribosomal protein S9
MSKLMISGKRKTSIAKASLTDGNGNIFYKGHNLSNLRPFHRLSILEPIRIYENTLGKFPYDVQLRVSGGGKEGQIQAARLALAKVLVAKTKNKELKDAYLQYDRHILVADVRRKEQRKPGDSKARAKRQKSYR